MHNRSIGSSRCLWRLALITLLLFTAGCDADYLPLPNLNVPQEPAPASPTMPPATTTPLQPAEPEVPTETAPVQPTPVQEQPASPTPVAEQTAAPTPVLEQPVAQTTLPPSGGPQLAFLNQGDVWLLDQPDGKPYPLTVAGDILSFAWSPDGQRLATYNGHTLCFFNSDGSVRTACLELGLDDIQASVTRNIVWSPDQSRVVLWNPFNPWDEGAIGWLIVGLDTANEMYRIQDPVDWGASLAPNNEAGGFTGQAVFLSDGRLVGTLTHRYLCSDEGGCHYQLYEFNFESKSLTPYPNNPQEGWSEGQRLVLSDDGRILTNYGVFFFGCDSYVTFADNFDLTSQARTAYNLEGQAMLDLALSPDMKAGVFARTSGCVSETEVAWNQAEVSYTAALYEGKIAQALLRRALGDFAHEISVIGVQ